MMNPNPKVTTRSVPVAPSFVPAHDIPIQSVTLSNGRYTTELNGAGSGRSDCGDVAITRWLPGNHESDGFHIYLRDLDDDFVWSAGYLPTCVPPQQYEFKCNRGLAEFHRVDREIECRLAVFVSPHDEIEFRYARLTNVDTRPRRIELTSYLEWVLGSRNGDISHPVFSKLFVETEICTLRNAILARRRPRHAEEMAFWGFHAIRTDGTATGCPGIQFETNRARFIGRGRSLKRPLALERGRDLSGDSGAVLDPIASIRTEAALKPGETRRIVFILGGSRDLSRVEELLEKYRKLMVIEQELERANLANDATYPHDGHANDVWSAEHHRDIVYPPHKRFGLAATSHTPERRFVPAIAQDFAESGDDDEQERLQFENGCGGFSADGREYVIRVRPAGRHSHKRPPLPWVNVIANEEAGFLVTESGAGYTWSGNSRENRLTAWHNDPVVDPHSDAIWIRDEEAGVFWSPTPGPTPAASAYTIRHGFGYTIFEHASHDLAQQVTMFMPRREPVKLTLVKLENKSRRPRRLSIFSYLQWCLGANNSAAISTGFDNGRRLIWARNAVREHYGDRTAFSAVRPNQRGDGTAVSYSCDRGAFLGRFGNLDSPEALVSDSELDRQTVNGTDACAAWQLPVELPPGGTFECTFLLGETTDLANSTSLMDKFSESDQVQRALDDVRRFWRDTLSAVAIETPVREIDLMVNGWLPYQNLSCRLWARSAYYQPGGAFGFRDQLQDAAALVYHRPDLTRAQLLRHAAAQFVEGDVLHWWHADTRYGLRTRFSDDLLWLALVAAEYVDTTGDSPILDEVVPFLTASPLEKGQQEAFLLPESSGAQGTLYEHCCRALDHGLTTGRNGLPLIGCGDWNDGFSRIGKEGAGESVWLGFFIDAILERMLPLCSLRSDWERVERYESYRDALRKALNSAGWDGAWYRRAFYDSGQPIGSSNSDECEIDALAQAWAVTSGAAPPERAAQAMESVESHLIDDDAGIIRLLTPPFNRTPHDPGYIKGYLPGIRENGGQYTHGVLWVVRAMAQLGRGTRAVELLKMLSPIWHTRSAENVAVYQTEPYVVAADVYGELPHVGRGGWTWYTGSAGWMFRVAVESILGLSISDGKTLVLNPTIPATWPRCRISYRLPGGASKYDITVENPAGKEHGVSMATVDGEPVSVSDGVARVPLRFDGLLHRVVVWM